MARVKSRADLIEYVFRTLGEPVIDVELTEDQIDDIIDESIDKYSEYAYDGQMEKTFKVTLEAGVSQYVLDETISTIKEVRISNSSSPFTLPGGYVVHSNYQISGVGSRGGVAELKELLSKYQDIENFFNIPINYDFNSNSHIITFFDNINSSDILIHANVYYRPGEVDGIYNHQWIKEMTVAQCRLRWGNNIGKVSGALVGGATINFDAIAAQGQADIERLDVELLERWSPPLGVFIG